MLDIKEVQFAQYNKRQNHKNPTKYIVPTSMTVLEYSSENLEYFVVDEIVNNKTECLKILVERRILFRELQLSLSSTPLFTMPLGIQYRTKNRPKELIGEKFYNAKVMTVDLSFNPVVGPEAVWNYSGTTDPDRGFTDDSPLPLRGQSKWHTTQAIEKSNAWIYMIQERLDTEFQALYTSPTYNLDGYLEVTKKLKDSIIKGV